MGTDNIGRKWFRAVAGSWLPLIHCLFCGRHRWVSSRREYLEQHVTKNGKAYVRCYLLGSYLLGTDGDNWYLILASKQLTLSRCFEHGRPWSTSLHGPLGAHYPPIFRSHVLFHCHIGKIPAMADTEEGTTSLESDSIMTSNIGQRMHDNRGRPNRKHDRTSCPPQRCSCTWHHYIRSGSWAGHISLGTLP